MPQKIVFEKVCTLVLVGVILSSLLPRCSAQKGERAYEPKARQSTTSEDSAFELEGGVFDANELVAIVADKMVSEGTNTTVSGGSRRKVQAYVCDGEPQGDAEWFVGQTTGNTLDLTSRTCRGVYGESPLSDP